MHAYKFKILPASLGTASMGMIRVTCCDDCPMAQVVEKTSHVCMNPAAPDNDGYGQSLHHEDTRNIPAWCPMRQGGQTERVIIMLDESEFFKP